MSNRDGGLPDRQGVHALSDAYVADYAALDPIMATYLGIPGNEQDLTDYSPDGHLARAELSARAVRHIEAAQPADAAERVARAVFTERGEVTREVHDAGLDLGALNVTFSPVQHLREVFDLMPTDTSEDWSAVAVRLGRVPQALTGLRASLSRAADTGTVTAARQVVRVADQCETWAGLRGAPSYFESFTDPARQSGVSGTLLTALDAGARAAAGAYADFAAFLRDELAPRAPENDAVGADVYRIVSRQFTGARLDLQEAYAWGWEEFLRVEAEVRQVADRVRRGATPAEAAAVLDADPRYQVRGRRGLVEWMRSLSTKALADLRDREFDIPDELMTLACRIAPPGGGVGAYYNGPTQDFGRPGTMWWSVPADREVFPTWREATTVYHEGAPGHHLQIGTAVHRSDRLNSFQRLLCWVPGHGEGWALYAERLMRDLGHLDDGELLGMLGAQLLRAARVVIDLGTHLELGLPAGCGFHEGERWSPALGLELLLNRTIVDPAQARDEIDRYLGWPGQAPAYKLGERLWLTARDEARDRHGDAFDLRIFHSQALELGSMGLDTLREQLAALPATAGAGPTA
ncbi:DUF885 domain-containing protein [Streptomyces sp. NPDC060006]|uniref:DUF885 domain-containing protein n=1 Tax=unclassified Streptomyces TaxID=2593676 RepID=UPI003639FC44